MKRLADVLEDLREYLSPIYEEKDTMHDLSHIDRMTKRALELTDGTSADSSLIQCAALLHGVVYSHESQIIEFLRSEGVPDTAVDGALSVAWESQKESPPATVEGKILHDAHLLEGDENFLVTKALVTGSVRGQSLRASAEYLERQLGTLRCVDSENQKEYERREMIAREYIAKLLKEL